MADPHSLPAPTSLVETCPIATSDLEETKVVHRLMLLKDAVVSDIASGTPGRVPIWSMMVQVRLGGVPF